MESGVKSALKSLKERGLGNFLRDLKEVGFLNVLLDGNILQTKIHNIGATLVGIDKFGNKYYEKYGDTQYGATLVGVDKFDIKYYEKYRDVQCGRHRWVEYAEKNRYNASQVPPEWHGWLHHITDRTGDELLMLKPTKYGVEHRENLTGQGEDYIYHSKGHALNPGQRDWSRYQSWQPTKTQ